MTNSAAEYYSCLDANKIPTMLDVCEFQNKKQNVLSIPKFDKLWATHFDMGECLLSENGAKTAQ